MRRRHTHCDGAFFIGYFQGFLSDASLKGGVQSAGLGLEWHFLQVLVMGGKETLPWHTPHFCPNKIADMLI